MTRSRLVQVVVGLVLMLSLLLGGVAMSGGTAHAAIARPAVSCSGTGCNGQFASSTGCNNGDTKLQEVSVYDGALYLGSVSLYWSPTCQTNWAHLHNGGSFSAAVFVEQCISPPVQYYAGRYNVSFDSPMVYSPTTKAYASGNLQDVQGIHFGTTNCY